MTYTEIIKALGKNMDLIDLIERQQAEIDNLNHTLLGVMHSVDKRLDGDGKEGEKKMKKLFISVPMKGRTEENIRKSIDIMHKIAEIVFGEELEVIPSYVEDKPPKDSKEAIWYLGKSIEKLSEADFFIGIKWQEFFKGCNIEREIAYNHGIKSFEIDYTLFPDAVEIERKYYDDMVKRPKE